MKKDKTNFSKRIESFFRLPIYFILIIAILTVIVVIKDKELGFMFLMVLVISSMLGFFVIFFVKRNIMTEIIEFSMKFASIQKELIKNFNIPLVLINEEGRIYWYNNTFETINGDKDILNSSIHSIIPGLNSNFNSGEKRIEKEVELNDTIYNVVIEKIEIESKNNKQNKLNKFREVIYIGYFFDITKQHELEIINDEQKAVVGLLYIDNYDEVIQSIEDVRRPLLIALIDRNINKFSKEIDGILKKFEKDKYIIVFQKKYLDKLKENKFEILDTIREINIGNEMSVTLSFGIGLNSESYTKSVDYSRTSIDLALGRGGDQAVVKDHERLSFYGGKTRGVEKSTRVKARIKAHAFKELIEESDMILIMGHKVPDMDSLGASLGVYACANHLKKPAHIIINQVTTSVKSLYDKIISDDDYPEDLFINNQQAIDYFTDRTLLVIVDVSRPSYTEYPELLTYIKNVVVFDHHRITPDRIDNAVLSYVETYASSTCEMISEITRYISDDIKLKPIEADALFAGISVDTKNFVAKAGVKTFEAAAYLRRSGADVVRVRKLFKNDMASYKAKATAVRDAEIYRDNIAITICPSDVTNPNLVGAQAADELLNISGIKASFVLTNVDNIIYISARSLDDVNVQLIMEKLGGGGHLSVAGAQLTNYTMSGAIEILKDTIDEYFKEGEHK